MAPREGKPQIITKHTPPAPAASVTSLKSGPMAKPVDTSNLAPLPALIFGSRWLQLPLYLGLIGAHGVYLVLFLKELWHLITHSTSFTEQQIMLVVLGLIDVVMISNLLVMWSAGGTTT